MLLTLFTIELVNIAEIMSKSTKVLLNSSDLCLLFMFYLSVCVFVLRAAAHGGLCCEFTPH